MIINLIFVFIVLLFGTFLIHSIWRDIRNRNRILKLEKEIKTANERLQMMESQKMEFASITSREMRTSLTGIKGYASMILDGTFGTIPDTARDAVEKLYKSSEKVVELTDGLLAVPHIDKDDTDQSAT
jgi:signal transduction histidine kinase